MFIFASCKKENLIESTTKIVFASDPYELAVGIQTRIDPEGGDGKYTIKQIGDTSIVDGYSDGEYIFLTAKKYGTTTLEVVDSSQKASGMIHLIVKDLVIRTTRIKVPVRGVGEIIVESKRKNYSVTVTDTTIAKPIGFSLYKPTNYRIQAIDFGTTSIVVLDSNTMETKIIPMEVLHWPAGFVKFSSKEFSFNVTNDNVDGFVYGYYKIENSRFFQDVVRIYAYRYYPDNSFDLFLISLDTDSLYQGLHIQYPDTPSQRFLLWFVQANDSDSGSYQSFSGEMSFTKISSSSFAGTFSGECFYVTDLGEGVRIDSTRRLDITDGMFEITLFDTDAFEKYSTSKNIPLKSSGIFHPF